MKNLKYLAAVSVFGFIAAAVYAGGQGENAAASSGPSEISYMAWYNTTESEAADTQKILDKFNEAQSGVHVKLISVSRADYEAKLTTMAAGNQLPDVALMPEPEVLGWAIAGKLADVGDVFKGEDVPLKSLAFTYHGKVVAYSVADEVLVLYYNKKLFDAAGLPYPPATADTAWTWKQFVDVATKLTKDKNGNTPNDPGFDPDNIVTYGADFNRLGWMWPILAVSNGGGVMTPDGQKLLLGTPETIEAAQAIADLYLKDHVAPSPSARAAMPALDVTLLTDKVAMATSGQWEIGVSLKNSLAAGLEYGVGVLPKMKTAVTYNTGGPNVIFSTTKNLAAAKTFLHWYSQESNNWGLITGGIWMPVSKKWYASDAAIRKWADNPIHPPFDEYKTAVVDYAMNNAVQVPWYYFPNYNLLDDLLNSGMDAVWNGEKSAHDALLYDILPKAQQIFDQNKP